MKLEVWIYEQHEVGNGDKVTEGPARGGSCAQKAKGFSIYLFICEKADSYVNASSHAGFYARPSENLPLSGGGHGEGSSHAGFCVRLSENPPLSGGGWGGLPYSCTPMDWFDKKLLVIVTVWADFPCTQGVPVLFRRRHRGTSPKMIIELRVRLLCPGGSGTCTVPRGLRV